MIKVERALLSVYDKAGIADFARGLAKLGAKLLSSGGTSKALASAGIEHTQVSDLTGFPEVLGGRVKTLHPAIHAAILADSADPEHMADLRRHGIDAIQLVVVSLYPFEKVAADPSASIEDLIEMIDIGGPAMIRAAAKNYRCVAVVTSPSQYDRILKEIEGTGGISPETSAKLALAAFATTGSYDRAIRSVLAARVKGEEPPRVSEYPAEMAPHMIKAYDLRYGENPHQSAAFYTVPEPPRATLGSARQLSGKELSYNNIRDLDAALQLAQEFSEPTAAIIKHASPCGVASSEGLPEAFERALSADPVSAYGGVVAVNAQIDVGTAERMAQENTFFEVICSPGFDDEALQMLKTKRKWGKNVRLMTLDGEIRRGPGDPWEVRKVRGGYLVQEWDDAMESPEEFKVVTKRAPRDEELKDLAFAWRVVKHVRSNAIALAKDKRTVGICGGQVNRVDAVRISVERAGDQAKGSVLASDAFFPFSDGPEAAAHAGVTAIIHPGGSIRDEDSVKLADEHGMAMVLTGVRHFKH
jgi:phosphoribosylaminoimidazolecarboxamide formyltransferase/IMP cyclohydrolase